MRHEASVAVHSEVCADVTAQVGTQMLGLEDTKKGMEYELVSASRFLRVESARSNGPLARLRLSGELDHFSGPVLAAAFNTLDLGEVALLEVDVEALSFIDAGGIGSLLTVEQACGGSGHLVLRNASPLVLRVLSLCGLGHLVG